MLKRAPDLARLLELPIQPDRHTPLDLDAFRRQIDYALGAPDRYYDAPDSYAGTSELAAIVDTADRFGEAGDWANAGPIYARKTVTCPPCKTSSKKQAYENGVQGLPCRKASFALQSIIFQGG